MRILRYFILSLILISSVSAQEKSLRGQANHPSRNIELTIHPHSWATSRETDYSYLAGKTIRIRCVWKNKGKEAATILLKDHDSYHGTLSYPVGMKTRVRDSNGNVRTSTHEFGEWWSNYILWSTLFPETPGDRITLRPNEEVVRIVPLDEVLLGMDGLENGLQEGEYTVELKLDEIVSNELRIKVKAKK